MAAPVSWAIVTGASSGIGMALAAEVASRGHNVVLVARRADVLKTLAAKLRLQHAVDTLVVAADLAKPDAAEHVYNATAELGSQVELLIANAGMAWYGDSVAVPRLSDHRSSCRELRETTHPA